MNFYTSLARLAVESFVKNKTIIQPPKNTPKEFLEQRAGTFVTITEEGKLRGCIGTYLPTKINIAQEIIHNAIAAATKDYRFGPVKEYELPHLSYIVYVLSNPELVKEVRAGSFTNNLKELENKLNPQKYGIIVKTFPFVFPNQPNQENIVFDNHTIPKTGLLLPDLEGVETAEKQIRIACEKGDINPNNEKFIIYKFTTIKYQEDD